MTSFSNVLGFSKEPRRRIDRNRGKDAISGRNLPILPGDLVIPFAQV
jgi:hypothetical protein